MTAPLTPGPPHPSQSRPELGVQAGEWGDVGGCLQPLQLGPSVENPSPSKPRRPWASSRSASQAPRRRPVGPPHTRLRTQRPVRSSLQDGPAPQRDVPGPPEQRPVGGWTPIILPAPPQSLTRKVSTPQTCQRLPRTPHCTPWVTGPAGPARGPVLRQPGHNQHQGASSQAPPPEAFPARSLCRRRPCPTAENLSLWFFHVGGGAGRAWSRGTGGLPLPGSPPLRRSPKPVQAPQPWGHPQAGLLPDTVLLSG